MKTLFVIITCFILGAPAMMLGQVGIKADGSAPDGSAMLDVQSTLKGVLIPRMDSIQRISIANPVAGLMVYQNTNHQFYYFNGVNWLRLGSDNLGNHTFTQTLKTNGFWISNDGGSEGIFILSNGYVGINNSSPSSELDINGILEVTGSASIGNANIQSGDFVANPLNGVINTGGSINPNSNVIGDVTTPTQTIATGDEDLWIQGDLEVTGNGYKTGGGSWATISDSRYKKNVEPFTDGLAQVMQIEPVSFSYNEKLSANLTENRYIGVLAQDMLEVAPYMVEERYLGRKVREIENGVDEILEQGELAYTFDPSALDYLLINAVQEQQNTIRLQSEKISQLEAYIVSIQAALKDIQAQVDTFK